MPSCAFVADAVTAYVAAPAVGDDVACMLVVAVAPGATVNDVDPSVPVQPAGTAPARLKPAAVHEAPSLLLTDTV